MMIGLTVTTAVGAGVVAGVFFTFSTFVMKALGQLPSRQGLAAMQAVNLAAPSVLFMTLLFGTAVLSVVTAVQAVGQLGEPAASWGFAGALFYLVAIVTTIIYHVPRNNRLAVLDVDAPGADLAWTKYHRSWTRWNHLRTATCAMAAVALTMAARIG